MTQQPPDREAIARALSKVFHGDHGEWRGFLTKADEMIRAGITIDEPADAILSSFPQTRPSESGELSSAFVSIVNASHDLDAAIDRNKDAPCPTLILKRIERLQNSVNKMKAVAETDAVAPTDMVLVPRDAEEWTVEQYNAFWKAYDEHPEGEGKFNSWMAGIEAMLSSSPSMRGSEKT